MKIMFICTGNICRSAMAEGLLRKRAEDENIVLEVCSAGTYAYTGDYASDSAIKVMKDYGVDLSEHRATNISDAKLDDVDVILCATQKHKQTLMFLYPDLKQKMYTMKEYAGTAKDMTDFDIEDPWGKDYKTYKKCAIQIAECVEGIIDRI